MRIVNDLCKQAGRQLGAGAKKVHGLENGVDWVWKILLTVSPASNRLRWRPSCPSTSHLDTQHSTCPTRTVARTLFENSSKKGTAPGCAISLHMKLGSRRVKQRIRLGRLRPRTSFVAEMTPVFHYTIGDITVDDGARVLDLNGQKITGLYAACQDVEVQSSINTVSAASGP
ncbi:hypothetical protein D9758_013339 [Tetrapyrgos nigripes]|uniref:FAD-dependent oxidoreductase 2 FAD-binding domain-containing protein n=1 Tax=Tetrapyrgos nigripes TaxID=182062 RepID=A0A8H5FJP3_9AGAR|nr:hypothetical protein D9758_013339 [Tetrapyrgos nigripes]